MVRNNEESLSWYRATSYLQHSSALSKNYTVPTLLDCQDVVSTSQHFYGGKVVFVMNEHLESIYIPASGVS
jgi:hypothetical protein